MTITELRDQLKQSMLSKDADKTGIIRMLLSALNYSAIAKSKKQEELSETDITEVIMKEIKTRKESMEEYSKNGAEDRAAKEKYEIETLTTFLPEMLDEAGALTEIQRILSQADANIAIGPATGMVMKELKGKVDPAIVHKVLGDLLKK